jgi:hypothetical protein
VRGRAVTPAQRANRRYKAKHKEREYLRNQARQEALSALARKHPAEFVALYQAELVHLGIAPQSIGMQRPCSCGGTIVRKQPVGGWPSKCDDCRHPLCGCGCGERTAGSAFMRGHHLRLSADERRAVRERNVAA